MLLMTIQNGITQQEKTIVYVRQDSSIKLNVGDKLLIRSRFSYLTEPKTPMNLTKGFGK